MRPQFDLGHGTRKIGALHVQFKGSNCILIFGVTYWELTPWCVVMPSILPISDFDLSDAPTISIPSAASGKPSLRRLFEEFSVSQVALPTNMETRRHRCFCKSLELVSLVELITISGMDMYLLRLLSSAEELNENASEK
jgi:hypothetical protein